MRQEIHGCGGIVSLKLEEVLDFSHCQNLLFWEKGLINLEKKKKNLTLFLPWLLGIISWLLIRREVSETWS